MWHRTGANRGYWTVSANCWADKAASKVPELQRRYSYSGKPIMLATVIKRFCCFLGQCCQWLCFHFMSVCLSVSLSVCRTTQKVVDDFSNSFEGCMFTRNFLNKIFTTAWQGQFITSVLWHCWLGDRKGIQPVKTGCWFVGGDDLTVGLHVLQLQFLPPPPSPLAPVESRMETFWYQLTQVHLENGR